MTLKPELELKANKKDICDSNLAEYVNKDGCGINVCCSRDV